MSDKGPHSLIRLLCIVLWVLIVGGLSYQNYLLQKKVRSLQQFQTKIPGTEGLAYSIDEISLVLGSLKAENKTYRASLKRQAINLKECMSRLPQNEIDDFHRRHRKELQHKMAK